jgi:hypothetical protein
VLPKDLNEDTVEALFFDEFNRSHKKIRNAVMELIQFKSINGRKFKNLKFVWAAINPHTEETEEYEVDKLDPAIQDRFHVYVQVPFEPSITYFRNTHGDIGRNAIEWWSKLNSDIKTAISPRRLDYALNIYSAGGDMSYALPNTVNVSELEEFLVNGNIVDVVSNLNTETDITNWLADVNNKYRVIKYIVKDEVLSKSKTKKYPVLEKVGRFLSEEDVKSMTSNPKVEKVLSTIPAFMSLVNVTPQTNKYDTVELTAALTVAYDAIGDRNNNSALRFKVLQNAIKTINVSREVMIESEPARILFAQLWAKYFRRSNWSSVHNSNKLPVFKEGIEIFNTLYTVDERGMYVFKNQDVLADYGPEYTIKY